MRLSMLRPLAVGLGLAACADSERAVGPEGDTRIPPKLSVVTFGLTTIGEPGSWSEPRRINELGQVLFRPLSSDVRPAVWTNGALSTVFVPSDALTAQASGFNAAAVVTGAVDEQAAVWIDGELTLLQVPQEMTSSLALAINDRGQIVGRAQEGAERYAVYWPSMDDPMAVLPGGGIQAIAINNAGEIAGHVLDVPNNLPVPAYWASPTSTPQWLSEPGTDVCASLSAISERGEIVGTCGDAAVYWPRGTADPIALPGVGRALGINELGQIVGSRRNTASEDRPTMWQKEGGSYRAFDLGLPPGYEKGVVTGVNNHGQAIGSAVGGDLVSLLYRIPARVELDVVPGAGTSLKLGGGGTVAPALLGSRWLHAGDIDPGTLTLGDDSGNDTPIARKKGAPISRLTDVNRDGYLDLVAEFSKQALVKNGDLSVGAQLLVIQGRLREGTPLRGADEVVGTR